jgi:hypothetical protein
MLGGNYSYVHLSEMRDYFLWHLIADETMFIGDAAALEEIL